MALPESFLDELISRNEISDVASSYVQLSKKSGSNMFGLCPFHSEKTPSFSVSVDKQIYYCFGCGKGGSVINFIMEIENLSFMDAVHFLAKRAGMTVPEDGDRDTRYQRQRILDLNREAARFFHNMLSQEEGRAVQEYLDGRKIRKSTATKFGLGAAPDSWDSLISAMTPLGYDKQDLINAGLAVKNAKSGGIYDKFRNRLMFPVIDLRGDVVGFGGRVLDKSEPKYLNTPETVAFSKRRVLYGINLAKKSKRGNIILCEGNIDVITLHQAGFDNAVASMGTSLTTEQTRMLSRYTKEIVICFDSDEAGKKATVRALDILKSGDFNVKVLRLPAIERDGKYVKVDADEYIKLYGPEGFEKLLTGSDSHMEYRLLEIEAKYDLNIDEQRVAYIKEASELIASVGSPAEREVYAHRAAQAANISSEAMSLEVKRGVKSRASRAKKERELGAQRPSAVWRPREKSIRYENDRSAIAEEGVIRLFVLEPGLFGSGIGLCSEDFSSPFLGKVYKILEERRMAGKSIEIPALSSELTPDEASRLTGILQKRETLQKGDKILEDYIGIIKTEKMKRSPEIDLLAYSEKLREKKGYGG